MASFMNRLRPGSIASAGRDATRRRKPLQFEPLEERALMSFTVGRMAQDSAGDVYVVGTLNGQFNFDPGGNARGLLNTPVATAVVAEYSVANTLLWVKPFTSSSGGTSAATGVAVNNSTQAIYVTGNFSGTVDLNAGDSPSDMVTSNGGTDGFVVELAQGGGLMPNGARVFGGASNDSATDVALSSDGSTVYVSGDYIGSVVINPGTTLTSPGSVQSDSFVMRLNSGLGFLTATPINQVDSSGLRLAVDGSGDAYLVGRPLAPPAAGSSTMPLSPSSTRAAISSRHEDSAAPPRAAYAPRQLESQSTAQAIFTLMDSSREPGSTLIPPSAPATWHSTLRVRPIPSCSSSTRTSTSSGRGGLERAARITPTTWPSTTRAMVPCT